MPTKPAQHRPLTKPRNRERRPSACMRGYGRKWQAAVKAFINEYPLCRYCLDQGRRTPSETADHRVPHKGDMRLFWDKGNWVPCCLSCNSRKAVREEGALRRLPKGACST